MDIVMYVLLQYLWITKLRIAKIHNFIKQFIHNYKVIFYALLFQLFEVMGEDLSNIIIVTSIRIRQSGLSTITQDCGNSFGYHKFRKTRSSD